jgi:hypothetical protein
MDPTHRMLWEPDSRDSFASPVHLWIIEKQVCKLGPIREPCRLHSTRATERRQLLRQLRAPGHGVPRSFPPPPLVRLPFPLLPGSPSCQYLSLAATSTSSLHIKSLQFSFLQRMSCCCSIVIGVEFFPGVFPGSICCISCFQEVALPYYSPSTYSLLFRQ